MLINKSWNGFGIYFFYKIVRNVCVSAAEKLVVISYTNIDRHVFSGGDGEVGAPLSFFKTEKCPDSGKKYPDYINL